MKRLLICVSLFSLVALQTEARIINIPDDFEIIQGGIAAAEEGDTVLVQPGEYDGNINFVGKNITVGSMFLFEADNKIIDETIIRGDGDNCVVIFHDSETRSAVLKGFTITDGDCYAGGGIMCQDASPTITNCTVLRNTARYGGGIFIGNNCSPIVSCCLITRNNSLEDGGGIHIGIGGEAFIDSCVICNNFADRRGEGGGILCTRSELTITNTVIYSNFGYYGGGLGCDRARIWMSNCTITSNRAQRLGGGIFLRDYDDDHRETHPVLNNCILWYSEPHGIYFYEEDGQSEISIRYCDIEGGEDDIVLNDNGVVNWGVGNINSNPRFVNPNRGDYHLTYESPCIDAGDPEVDLDPDGTRADMGAYYIQSQDIDVDPGALEFANVQNGSIDSLAVVIRNIGLIPLRITSQIIMPEEAPFSVRPDDEIIIRPESEYIDWVFFSPEVESQYEAVLNIESNDPDEETVIVYLAGNALSVTDLIHNPSVFTLYPAFPNPFNSLAQVSFQLDRSGSIRLSLIDLNGKRIRTIMDGNLDAGFHTAALDGSDLPNGVYLVELVTREHRSLRKLILLR